MIERSPSAQLFFDEFERHCREREAADAARDPKQHRLTLVMAPGTNTNCRRFYCGRDGMKATIRYCVSCHPNAVGLFLFFRERQTRNGIVRTEFEAFRSKRLALSWAKRCRNEWLQERAEKIAAGRGGVRLGPAGLGAAGRG